MKSLRKALKYIVSPLILALILISFNAYAIRRWLLFLRYGGEVITYEKDDQVFIGDIYRELKDQKKATT